MWWRGKNIRNTLLNEKSKFQSTMNNITVFLWNNNKFSYMHKKYKEIKQPGKVYSKLLAVISNRCVGNRKSPSRKSYF